MNYRLVVLTHGDGPTLEDTLDSFGDHVQGRPPTDVVIVRDGPGYTYVPSWQRHVPTWRVLQVAPGPVGFCKATAYAWACGAAPGPEFVFYLEHDFRITRPVYLVAMAAVLDANPQLVQMALMRDAVNDAEKAAGGLFESRPGQYERRSTHIPLEASPFRGSGAGGRVIDPGVVTADWLEHRAYATTNPSLMRRQFMADHPWPDYDAECEGRFGIDLVLSGYSFGVWGTGEPWVEHIGARTGFGY